MSPLGPRPFDIDAFLAFTEGRESRWELFAGEAVAAEPETVRHVMAKGDAVRVLHAQVRSEGLRCLVLGSGATVRIGAHDAFVPDALVVCPPPPPDAVLIDNPLIVVEVLSPATAAVDHGIKLEGYVSLPSVAHYLILDADRRVVIHHRRGQAGVIETRILSGGELALEPPGLTVVLEDLFGPPDEPTA